MHLLLTSPLSWQAACTLLLLAFVSHAEAVGEVGQVPNKCYATMPTDLPITVSYSMSSTLSITTFTFLVRLSNFLANYLLDVLHF